MISPALIKSLLLIWPLLAGLFLLMVGNGLQGTLLGLRADAAGFPVFLTSAIMSLYYMGFLVGCLFIPRLISSVGHIRVFAALACTAAPIILIHGLFVDPWVWACVRIISGISFAGLFIVIESWLNSIAVNRLRGKIYGFYLLALHGGLFLGQFFIPLAPVESMILFVLISSLLSLSVLPITLADKPAPGYQEPETLPLKKLFKTSPLSLASVFASGFCAGSIFGIGALYALAIGLNNEETAFLIACYILGSATMPLLIGAISDSMDRRRMITILALCAFTISITIALTSWVYILFFLFGGVVTSIYSIGVAYMSDQLKPSEMVSTSTSLILLNGAGAALGPLITGFFLGSAGPQSFFFICAALSFAFFLFAVYRSMIGTPTDIDDQRPFIPTPARSATTPFDIIEKD